MVADCSMPVLQPQEVFSRQELMDGLTAPASVMIVYDVGAAIRAFSIVRPVPMFLSIAVLYGVLCNK